MKILKRQQLAVTVKAEDVVNIQNGIGSSLDMFSLHKEIIEDSYSLWFPRKGIPIVILHTLRPTTVAIFQSNGSK